MQKVAILIMLTLLFLLPLACGDEQADSDDDQYGSVELVSLDDKYSYTIGVSIANQLKSEGFDINVDAIAKAMTDVLKENTLAMTDDEMNLTLTEMNNKMMVGQMSPEQKQLAEKNLAEANAFLDENAKKDGVVVLPSGLQYKVITEGTGSVPVDTSTVRTHYHGTFIDGSVFDSSVERDDPAQFPVNGVIRGWTEALQLMKVGAKW